MFEELGKKYLIIIAIINILFIIFELFLILYINIDPLHPFSFVLTLNFFFTPSLS